MDLVNIRGNSLFKFGNDKRKTIWDDFMYRYHTDNLDPSEYTVGIINSVEGGYDWHNNYKFQPASILIKDEKTKKVISQGKYNINKGYAGPNHYLGYIWPYIEKSGDLQDGVINNNPPILTYCCSVAGFITVKSDDKTYLGKFDLIDLSVASFRGKDTLEVLVNPIGEGNVQIISPSNGESINNFENLKLRVQPLDGMELSKWQLFAEHDEQSILLSEGNVAVSGDIISVPAENLEQLKDYEGQIDLTLKATYLSQNLNSEIEEDNSKSNAIVLSDKKTNIKLQNKPVISQILILNKNDMRIYGKGFGNDSGNMSIAITDQATTNVLRMSRDSNSSEYNDTFFVQDDFIEVIIGAPIDPKSEKALENWASKVLDIVVIRNDGIVSNEYHYVPIGNKTASLFLVLVHPPDIKNTPDSFDYDPPSISNETLTNHFEVKCQQDQTKIILGVETTDNILQNKYVERVDNCSADRPIVKDFIMENTDAEKVLESSKNGNYYWFVCRVVDGSNMSRSEKEDLSEPINDMLKTQYNDGNYYDCNKQQIKLVRRVYDTPPTPSDTPEPTPTTSVPFYDNSQTEF